MKLLQFIVGLVVLIGIYLAGPVLDYPPINYQQTSELPPNLEGLQQWLKDKESGVKSLKPQNEKLVVWAGEKAVKTPWSIVYIHGFSASRLETAPLSDVLAKKLQANVFYTRLAGHGQDANELAKATPQDWVIDYVQALEIGHRLGEKVLVISCSTGSTLATLASEASVRQAFEAHVFISPNFGPKDKRAEIILLPWGKEIAQWIEGKTHQTVASEPGEDLAWYKAYPTQALFPMMHLVKLARQSPLKDFHLPLMVLYSERDQVVDVNEIKTAFNAIGSNQKQMLSIDYSESKNQHVLAGSIKAPNAVEPLSEDILRWVRQLETTQGFR